MLVYPPKVAGLSESSHTPHAENTHTHTGTHTRTNVRTHRGTHIHTADPHALTSWIHCTMSLNPSYQRAFGSLLMIIPYTVRWRFRIGSYSCGPAGTRVSCFVSPTELSRKNASLFPWKTLTLWGTSRIVVGYVPDEDNAAEHLHVVRDNSVTEGPADLKR